MIEKHYGRYIKSDSREQLQRLFEAKPETFTETLAKADSVEIAQVGKKIGRSSWSE
jgi:hypothetical protein